MQLCPECQIQFKIANELQINDLKVFGLDPNMLENMFQVLNEFFSLYNKKLKISFLYTTFFTMFLIK
jgi:hypothetical protein